MSPIPSGIPSNVVPLNMSPLLMRGIARPPAGRTVTNGSLGCGKPWAPLVDAGNAITSAAAAMRARARISLREWVSAATMGLLLFAAGGHPHAPQEAVDGRSGVGRQF